MTRRIEAITFDFWNTLYAANSEAMELVRPRRIEALHRMLRRFGLDPSAQQVEDAYHSGFDAYVEAWAQEQQHGAPEHVAHVAALFGVTARPEDQEIFAETALEIEEAALTASLEPLPGVLETIPALALTGYRLGLISDTSLSPGRILRRLMADDGLLGCFGSLTFSDETGYTKPDPRMFEQTLAPLGVESGSAAHVGDTPRTDIAGAARMGMVTIRCAGAVDHVGPPEADYVIKDHREILEILDGAH